MKTNLLEQAFTESMKQFEPFENNPVLALAVSGGPDSMALLHCACRWKQSRQASLTILTVNHQLRAEAKDEVTKVAEWAKNLGLPCHTLTIPDKLSGNNISAQAREWRYRLLTRWCRDNHVLHLLTAHHQDDQVETFFNRLERGSGLEGLSCMRQITYMNGVRLLRPLLSSPKELISQFLLKEKIDWVKDPTNEDDKYFRARFRKIFPQLSDQGLVSAPRVMLAIANLQRANAMIEDELSRLTAQYIEISPAGYMMIDTGFLNKAPAEVALRVLNRCLMIIGGHRDSVRYSTLDHLYQRLLQAPLSTATAAGCCVVGGIKNKIMIYRERHAMAAPLKLEFGEQLWDCRFIVTYTAAKKDQMHCHVGQLSLGRSALLKWLKSNLITLNPVQRHLLKNLPSQVYPTLPAIYQQDQLVVVPYFNCHIPLFNLSDFSAVLWTARSLTKMESI